MVIMPLVNLFSFWPMPPFDYALIASISLVIGVAIMFFWRRKELRELNDEVDRLIKLCQDMEELIDKQALELESERSIRAGLEDAFLQQKKYTAEILEKTNFLYVAMVKNGTLSREDLKWLADKEVENIMKLFNK